jgi:hypothetical protein
VYVRPFPGSGPETAVSIGGGYGPRWSSDDSELNYITELHFIAASLQREPRFRVLSQERLFEGTRFWSSSFHPHYDVQKDGQRFLVLNMRRSDEEVAKINVVLEWFGELQQRVPAGR